MKFLKGNRKLKVDLGELKAESKVLSSFLSSKLKVEVTFKDKEVFVESNSTSANELKRLVNKYLYRKHLNHKYWVAIEGERVKIKKFKSSEKKKKDEKRPVPSTIKHGW